MAASNGSLKTGNGHVNGKPGGTPARRGRPGGKRRGIVSWILSSIARLATWFAIFTIVFRCPPTLDACDGDSPFVCKYYFQAKDIVSPHVQPYYDQYAAPYVDIAQPYYDTLNNNVLIPTRAYAIQYGTPWVKKAQQYGIAQWERNGHPQLLKLQALAQSHYDQSVAPYLVRSEAALGPYYDVARTNALQVYYEFLVPGYEVVQPYAAQGYEVASDFTTGTALPTAWWAWDKTYAFLDTAVWPQLRIAYLENVEPQLVRIGERLGRYKTKVKSKANVSDGDRPVAESSFSKPTSHPTSATTSIASDSTTQAASAEYDGDGAASPVEAPPANENESEKRKKAREMVAQDLEMWQTKFAAQADEGANDMEERVSEIAKQMLEENAHTTGRALVEKLEARVSSEMEKLKLMISAAVEKADESVDGAEDEAVKAVRAAGLAIKEQAQAVREWRQTYNTELQETVVRAADIHFQILDETRGLALQQIGMKWAWADGVTYKDWAKYHELKSTLSQWTDQLKELIVSHPSLLEAQDASAQVEDESMATASEAAKELSRLKEVALWKIVARDATDNFESDAMRLAAEAAEQAARAASEASQEAAEAGQTVLEQAEDAASGVLDGAQPGATALDESAKEAASSIAAVVDEAEEEAGDASSAAGTPANVTPTSEAYETTEHVATSQGASSVLTQAEGVISDTSEVPLETGEGASPAPSHDAEVAYSQYSDVDGDGDNDDAVDQVVDQDSADVDDLGSTVPGSASDPASSVLSNSEETFAEASDTASSEDTGASSAGFEDAPSATEASSAAEATVGSFASESSGSLFGQAETIVSNVSEEPALADDEEEELFHGDENPATDDHSVSHSTTSVKPTLFGAAAQAVSDRKPILEDYEDTDPAAGVAQSAESAYSNAVTAASEHYSSAVSVVSSQIYGTPKPVHEQLFSSISAAYDNAVAAASSRFSEAVAAASSGVKGTTTAAPTPTPLVDWSKVESIAAQRLSEGRLWAELQYQSAIIALGLATPTPTSKPGNYFEEAKKNYYAGIGLAQERYSSFVAAASSAMSSLTATPTPTDFAGTASSMASVAKESAASAAGSVYSAATHNVAAAVNVVDEGIVSVIDGASERVYLTGTAIAETWDNVIAELSGRIYGDQKQIGWYDSLFRDASSAASTATEAAAGQASSLTAPVGDAAATASAKAEKQYASVTELVSDLISGKEASFSQSVLSRLNAVYATTAASVESYARGAGQAAASVGDKVSGAVSHATDFVKETMRHGQDEL